MLTLVTYTGGGETERIARAIFDVLPAAREIRPLDEVESAQPYDLVFLGLASPAEGMEARAASLMGDPGRGNVLALFFTGAPVPDGASGIAEKAGAIDCLECDGRDEETSRRAQLFARQVLEKMHGIKATGCA